RVPGLLGCRLISLRGSMRTPTETQGRLFALALSHKALWPAGPLMPSASPNTVFSGLYTFEVSFTYYLFPPRLFSCLSINQLVAALTARLDSRPVACGYLDRFRSCKNATLSPSHS